MVLDGLRRGGLRGLGGLDHLAVPGQVTPLDFFVCVFVYRIGNAVGAWAVDCLIRAQTGMENQK